MRRQSLSRHGFTYSSGSIRRERGNIVSEPEFVDMFEEQQRLIDLAFNRFLEKVKFGGYDEDTAILIRVDADKPLSLERRAALVNKTHRYLTEHHPKVFAVFYCYVRDFIIDEVKEADYWHMT